ncbi:MAG: thioredoxin fold domain-containing protein [Planctomyces sp.]|nr:thioredoxin fold domain-containing protein [Planctomyces sp.]
MEIRDNDFSEMVLQSDRPVLVDFWASWCPPCKMMQPVVDKLSLKVGDWADVFSVNIDRCPGLASQFQVSGVPTFISYAGGQAVDRRTGALTEGQLLNLLYSARDKMPVTASEALTQPEGGEKITIVSGLPRSGTSMMMRMLEAGGIPALTDQQRTPDADNPNGYYEFEDVKSLANDTGWLANASGKAVKMVYSLLKHLPNDREYQVIFMRRNVDEILQSQKKMLERNGIPTEIPDATMKMLFDRELRQFYSWLPEQTHLKLINVSYNDLLSSPASTVHQINRHLGDCLNTDIMIQMVDPTLYRHRAA